MACESPERCSIMNEVKRFLTRGPLLFDGAMTTYKENRPAKAVLGEYIEAGANAIKTDTFSISSWLGEDREAALDALKTSILEAKEAAVDDVFLFGEIGPGVESDDAFSLFQTQVDVFLAAGVHNFLFETMAAPDGLAAIAAYIKEKAPDSFVIVSFAISSIGESAQGYGMQALYDALVDSKADAIGFNCHSGPRHMVEHVKTLVRTGKPLYIAPNAGYPQVLGWRVRYGGNPDYFAAAMKEIREAGVELLGGCCGTTPAHIRQTRAMLDRLPAHIPYRNEPRKERVAGTRAENWRGKVFVELDPPKNDQIDGFLHASKAFQKAGADLITIADSPIGRPRADASLLACRLHRELGIRPLPHMTCRDRNLNAIKALLMGLSSEGVRQVLFVTGDPLPQDSKAEVKAVYNFNSRKLMRYARDMAELSQGLAIFGALDVNAVNFDKQLELALEKEANGAVGFLTQPVLSKRALDNLRQARKTLKGFLFAGIYPIVSHRNAVFLHNEIHGMDMDEKIIERYEGLNRSEGEALAQRVSKQVMKACAPYCDGFYLMTPFQRVALMEALIVEAKALCREKMEK